MNNDQAQPSAQLSTNWQGASLTAASSSTLQTAIGLPSSESETLRRTQTVLALYYDPDLDQETKLNLRAEFVTALAAYPEWAMHRAFDRWVKEHTRRPSPGEISILAGREVEPLTSELARRQKQRAAQLPAPDRVTADAAARIMAEAGMTPERLMAVKRFPMATSSEDAKARSAEWDAAGQHWSETAAPDSAEWRQLQASRAANPLVQKADTQ